MLKRVSFDAHVAVADAKARRHEAVPAIQQVELDRHPVLPVPARVAEPGRVGEQLQVVGGDVVDVLLDHDLDQDHREDVPRGLEQPLVVPAVLLLEQPRDAIVLAQEQHVDHREPELQVAGVAAHGEQLTPLFVGDLLGAHDGDPVELLLPALVQVGRILLAVDDLVLEETALAGAQLPGDRVVEPVDLDQVDLVVGLVLGHVTDGLTRVGVAISLSAAGARSGGTRRRTTRRSTGTAPSTSRTASSPRLG